MIEGISGGGRQTYYLGQSTAVSAPAGRPPRVDPASSPASGDAQQQPTVTVGGAPDPADIDHDIYAATSAPAAPKAHKASDGTGPKTANDTGPQPTDAAEAATGTAADHVSQFLAQVTAVQSRYAIISDDDKTETSRRASTLMQQLLLTQVFSMPSFDTTADGSVASDDGSDEESSMSLPEQWYQEA